jgi:hypothetical protein
MARAQRGKHEGGEREHDDDGARELERLARRKPLREQPQQIAQHGERQQKDEQSKRRQRQREVARAQDEHTHERHDDERDDARPPGDARGQRPAVGDQVIAHVGDHEGENEQDDDGKQGGAAHGLMDARRVTTFRSLENCSRHDASDIAPSAGDKPRRRFSEQHWGKPQTYIREMCFRE